MPFPDAPTDASKHTVLVLLMYALDGIADQALPPVPGAIPPIAAISCRLIADWAAMSEVDILPMSAVTGKRKCLIEIFISVWAR